MKIVVILIASFLLYTSLFSLDFGVEVATGTYKNNSDSDNSHASIYGIRNNLYFNKNIALQLKLENLKSKTEDNDIQRYTTSLVYHANTIYKNLVPFFLAGIGYENAVKKLNFYDFGIGGKYYFTPSTNFISQLDIIKKIDSKATYGFSFGLGYDFNKAPVNKAINIDYNNINPNIMQKLSKNRTTSSEDIFLTPY